MSAALHGRLRDFGIGEVFQLIGQQRKSGVLEIQRRGARVRLRFDAGRIVDAAPAGDHEESALVDMLVRCGVFTRERMGELEAEREAALCALSQLLLDREILSPAELGEIQDLLTRNTLFDVLRWSDGSFRFDAQPVAHRRDPDALLGAEQVLMDGLRMIDEWREVASRAPAEDAALRRVGSFEAYRERRSDAEPGRIEREERLFLLVDGRTPARRLVDLARLDTFEGMRALARLREEELVEVVPPTEAPRTAWRSRRVHGGRRTSRRLTASLLGLGTLAVLAAATHAHVPMRRAPEMIPVPAEPLTEARTVLETRRARRLLDAQRFATGGDPASLGELRAWARRMGQPLAEGPGGEYYFERSEHGAILLAPEY